MSGKESANLYHLILGLPEELTSPNQYELLGFDQRVDEEPLIREAATAQHNKLLPWQDSDRSAEVRQLARAINQARDVLLDSAARAAYDATLGEWGDFVEDGPWIEPEELEPVEDFPPPSPTEPLSVRCPDCEASFKLRNRELIGRRVPCPECGFRFTIQAESTPKSNLNRNLNPRREGILRAAPPGDSPNDSDAELAALDNFDDLDELPDDQEPAPRPPGPARRPSENDRERFGNRPEPPPHRLAARSPARLERSPANPAKRWVGIGGGLVLGVGAVVLMAVFGGRLFSSSKHRVDLAHLPADCQSVGYFRIGDVAESPFFQAQLLKSPPLRNVVDTLRRRTGLEPHDLDVVLIGLKDDDLSRLNGSSIALTTPRLSAFVMVVRARKDWDRTRLIGAETESANHQGQTYHRLSPTAAGLSQPPQWGLYFADARTLIFGTEPEVLAAMDTQGKAPDWPDLEFLQPEFHVVAARVSTPENVISLNGNGRSSGFPQSLGFDSKNSQTVGAGLRLDGDQIEQVTFLAFANSGEAAQFVQGMEQGQEAFQHVRPHQLSPNDRGFHPPRAEQHGRHVAVITDGLGDLSHVAGGSLAFVPLALLAQLGRDDQPQALVQHQNPPDELPRQAPPPIADQDVPAPLDPPMLDVPPMLEPPVVPRMGGPVERPLGPPPDAQTLDGLIANLQAKGHFALQAALRLSLVEPVPERRQEVAKLLEASLSTGIHPEAFFAAQALGVWGGPENVPALLEQLKSRDLRDTFKQNEVLKALGRLKDPRAVPAMVQALANVHVRRGAVQGLKAFGTAAEPELLKLLPASDWQVQRTVCDLLRDFGTADSLPLLDQLATTGQPSVRQNAQLAANAIRARKE